MIARSLTSRSIVDRTMRLRRLEEAEWHVAHGAHNIMVEEKRIEKMDHDGQDTAHARSLIVVFKNLHQQHVEHRDRIAKALAGCGKSIADRL
jgi:hypothetical protein